MNTCAVAGMGTLGWVALIVVSIGCFFGYVWAAMLLADLNQYRSRYLHLVGWHEWFGTYDLESFDGGITWHAMSATAKGGRKVLGLADTVFPGLLSEPGVVSTERRARCYPTRNSQCSVSVKSNHAATSSMKQKLGKQLPTLSTFSSESNATSRDRNQALCMCLPVIVDVVC